MGGVVLDKEVEDGVAVGTREVEKVHVAQVDAREGDESRRLRSVEPLGVERRGKAEYAGREIKAITFAIRGCVGRYSHESGE